MGEQFPKFEQTEKKITKEEFLEMAKGLSEKREGFAYQGLDEESYVTLKAEGDEYPGFTTPIDELIARFEAEGMKVVLGDDPNSGNVFMLPVKSDNVQEDSVLPRHLKTSEDMDPELKKMVLAHKELAKAKKK